MMMPKQHHVYKVVDGCEIEADVYRPDDSQIRPAILWLHGGALIFGHRGGIAEDQLAFYLDAGYCVVAIDYRLAPEAKLPAIIEDLQDAYTWLVTEGPDLFQIDPQRIAVVGHSAGGYLTLMAGFCVEPRPKAIVAFYGYGDIISRWYSQPDPFYNQQPAVSQAEAEEAIEAAPLTGSSSEKRWRFYLYCRQQGLWPQMVAGHDPDQEAAWFQAYCPVQNVTQAYAPTLLLHGPNDTDVPFEQSQQMAAELGRHGVPHQFIIMQDRGHGFDHAGERLRDPEIATAFAQLRLFLDDHLSR
jgi:acetyl esterase/lipase